MIGKFRILICFEAASSHFRKICSVHDKSGSKASIKMHDLQDIAR